jgi:WxL Interacting Protein, peptidoglycan binding domain
MQSNTHQLLSKQPLLRLLIGLGAFIVSMQLPQMLIPSTAHADAPKQASFSIQYLDSGMKQYVTKSLRLNAVGGTKLQESITVVNSGKAAGTANIYMADALTSQNGGIAYQTQVSPRRVVATWITLPLNKVTLSPGQKRAFAIQIAIPPGTHPGVYVGGLVAEDASNLTFTRISKDSEFNFTIMKRSVLSIRITIPGTQVENLLDTSMRFSKANNLSAIVLSLNNLSTTIVAAKGTLLIADQQGHSIQSLPVQITDFLPQTAINYPVYLRGATLNAGVYLVTLDLQYGHSHTLHAQQNITVTTKNVNTLAAFLGSNQASSSGPPMWKTAGLGALLLIGSGTLCFWLFKFSLLLKRRMRTGMRH